jgi:hypothetical protein
LIIIIILHTIITAGGFIESLRFTEKQADDRILAGVKFPRLVRKPAGLEKTVGPLTV